MEQLSSIRSLIVLSLSLVALTLPALAQPAKQKVKKPIASPTEDERRPAGKINVTISEIVKEDAKAKSVAEGRLIPVRFVWLCGSTNNAKLVALEARLITLNTDGKQTTVTKKLVDWKVNTPITSVIDLPLANDVFAKNFTLELVGKFTDGKVEQAVNVVKQGNFPVPSLVGKKR